MDEIKIIELKKLFLVDDPGRLCILPYPDHPKGCPNFGRSESCPPHTLKLGDKYDLTKPNYFIVKPFDLAAQKTRMKNLHPEWSEKQCACCLFWQNGVRSKLKSECQRFVNEKENFNFKDYFDYRLIHEAMGLDVFKTAVEHGIPIERNPQNMVYKIAFVGVLK
jgi:predicted metal-binding protein